ncbi:MAG TPA: glycosyltransferase [Roseivirga sp.]
MSSILIFFLFIITIHIAFVILLGLKLLFHRSKTNSLTYPSVSVIVAARNERENLSKLLNKLSEQTYPNFEVIVANDRSTDGSKELLEELQAQYLFLQVLQIDELPMHWTGKKYALNLAVQQASNEVLLFTDADCVPNSNQWITKMASGFNSSTDIILGYSPYQVKSGWLNRFIQFETLLTGLQYLGLSVLKKHYMGVGRNMAIRKSIYDLKLLESIKHLEGGDDDLMIAQMANARNTTIMIDSDSFTLSWPEISLKSYLKQKTRHLSAGKHYHKKDQTLLGIFTLSCVVGWGLFLALIWTSSDTTLVWMVFGVRSIIYYVILKLLGRKLATEIEIWALPFLDLCYCFYYPLVAIRALATKKVEWKKVNNSQKKH